jgi:hypothetical protein
MWKSIAFASAVLLATSAAARAQDHSAKTVTLTGWFSDAQCAPARLKAAKLGPSNPDCSRTCIEKGVAAVFISESGHEILKVTDYAGVKENLGFHVEITGTLDPASKTVSVKSVKQLSWDGASCSRPRKAEVRR